MATYRAVSAALEEGVITPEFTVNCPGHFTFGNRTFKCNLPGGAGHGEAEEQFGGADADHGPVDERDGADLGSVDPRAVAAVEVLDVGCAAGRHFDDRVGAGGGVVG